MNKYYINPNYVINQTEDFYTIFTENVDKVFILHDLESKILLTFNEPMSIEIAVNIISKNFSEETFNKSECIQYINELIKNRILIC